MHFDDNKINEVILCSHFSKNKGTTDYFRDELISNKVPNYYLRHPTISSGIKFSELLYFDGKVDRVVRKYKKYSSNFLEMIRCFVVTTLVVFSLRRKVGVAIGFGGFNVIPFLIPRLIFNYQVFFWGVDYSPSRFGSKIMDKLYLVFETIACEWCDLVISSSERQASVRMAKHKLATEKSVVIHNGVKENTAYYYPRSQQELTLIYFGAISPHHGVVEFIQEQYVNRKPIFSIHIFGDGQMAKKLEQLILENQLSNFVTYHGACDTTYIEQFIVNCPSRLVGIAPYLVDEVSHVYYCDSLKIKEYVNYGIPFVASSGIAFPLNLSQFGRTYSNTQELTSILQEFEVAIPNTEKAAATIAQYQWGVLLAPLISKIRAICNQ